MLQHKELVSQVRANRNYLFKLNLLIGNDSFRIGKVSIPVDCYR